MKHYSGQHPFCVRVGKLSHRASWLEHDSISLEEQNVADMPNGCSDLGRTVQVRSLYLCEWRPPTSHHAKPERCTKAWLPGGITIFNGFALSMKHMAIPSGEEGIGCRSCLLILKRRRGKKDTEATQGCTLNFVIFFNTVETSFMENSFLFSTYSLIIKLELLSKLTPKRRFLFLRHKEGKRQREIKCSFFSVIIFHSLF